MELISDYLILQTFSLSLNISWLCEKKKKKAIPKTKTLRAHQLIHGAAF